MNKFKKIKLYELNTPIQKLNNIKINDNNFHVKREDLSGFILGGNKLRKIEYFMQDIVFQQRDYIVTYGSYQSNHCAITAAACSRLGLKCLLILLKPKQDIEYTGNYLLYNLLDVKIIWCEKNEVKETIDDTLFKLNKNGYKPYFIPGGGHGNLGTYAYIKAYEEIKKQSNQIKIKFDYIFHASGSGTTQSGLILGKEIHKDNIEIIGLSIARPKVKGIKVIMESILDYCNEVNIQLNSIESKINFVDNYIGKGYGDIYPEVLKTIKYVINKEGLLLDPVYTGKAFYGMLDYIQKNNIKNKNILFLHTGGTPIFFSKYKTFQEFNIN